MPTLISQLFWWPVTIQWAIWRHTLDYLEQKKRQFTSSLRFHQAVWREHLWCRSPSPDPWITSFFSSWLSWTVWDMRLGVPSCIGTPSSHQVGKSTISLVLTTWHIIKHEILLQCSFPPATWYKNRPKQDAFGLRWLNSTEVFADVWPGLGAGGWICRDMPLWTAQRPGETGELVGELVAANWNGVNKWMESKDRNWRFEVEYRACRASNHGVFVFVCLFPFTLSLSLSLSLSRSVFPSLFLFAN